METLEVVYGPVAGLLQGCVQRSYAPAVNSANPNLLPGGGSTCLYWLYLPWAPLLQGSGKEAKEVEVGLGR